MFLSNVWNDCPICGDNLFHTTTYGMLYCRKDMDLFSIYGSHYRVTKQSTTDKIYADYIYFITVDREFLVERTFDRTTIYTARRHEDWQVPSIINYVVRLDKINTVDKVKQLLLY